MKKWFLPAMMIFALVSCEKKEAVTETENYETDSTIVAETNEPIAQFKHVEYTPQQLTEFLAAKDNDTLYVTNFFATWCGPCMREMPHFKEKMTETKGQPVKWTFVSLDPKTDWPTKVKNFAEENGLTENVILLNGDFLTPQFFSANFKTYDGNGIPFTFMRMKDKTDEYMSMMTKEQLDEKIASFGISADASATDQSTAVGAEPGENRKSK